MKTTKKFMLLAALVFTQLLFTQCSSNNDKACSCSQTDIECTEPRDSSATAIAHAGSHPVCNIRIAYVDYDSLLTKYKFAQEIQKELIRKEMSFNNTIENERKSLQEEAAAFEQKVQNNVFATQERAQAEYEKIMKKDQELLQRSQSMIAELEEYRNTKYNELTLNINNYIQEYNSEKKYDFILTKIGGNMLYANDALNITDDIVKGLNAKK